MFLIFRTLCLMESEFLTQQVLNLRGAAVCAGWVLAVLKVVVLLTLTKLSSNVVRTSMKNIDFPYLAYHQLDISSAFEL